MKRGTTVAAVITGVGVALAVLVYGSAAGTATTTPGSVTTNAADATVVPVAVAAKKELTRAEKLNAALRSCAKKKPKSKRKRCEKAAKKRYKRKSNSGGEPEKKPTETPEQELTRAKTVSTAPTASNVTAGKSLFSSQCQICHGPTGEGTNTGPNLHNMPRAQSIAGIIEQLVKPEGAMPSFDSTFTFAEKEEAADFVAVDITHVATESH